MEKQVKTIDELGKKQREAIEGLGEKKFEALQSLDSNNRQIQICQPQIKSIEDISGKGQLNQQVINELQRLAEIERKANKEDLLYKTGDNKKDKIYDFRKYKTM